MDSFATRHSPTHHSLHQDTGHGSAFQMEVGIGENFHLHRSPSSPGLNRRAGFRSVGQVSNLHVALRASWKLAPQMAHIQMLKNHLEVCTVVDVVANLPERVEYLSLRWRFNGTFL
jgi:hypothetical protein